VEDVLSRPRGIDKRGSKGMRGEKERVEARRGQPERTRPGQARADHRGKPRDDRGKPRDDRGKPRDDRGKSKGAAPGKVGDTRSAPGKQGKKGKPGKPGGTASASAMGRAPSRIKAHRTEAGAKTSGAKRQGKRGKRR
jgi:ATP-dependent RNA helicase DeaD